MYTASIIMYAHIYNARVHTHIVVDRRDFEGGVYWDELAEICGKISRAVGFQGAARF